MKLLLLVILVSQNEITAAPTQQLLDLQKHVKQLEVQNEKFERILMNQNENFKKQFGALIEGKIELYADLEDKIEQIKSNQTPDIAFRATCTPKNKQYIVIWEDIEYNIGNAYNQSSGYFTAPRDGIYSLYAIFPFDSLESSFSVGLSIWVKYHFGIFQTFFKAVIHDTFTESWNQSLKLQKGDTVNIVLHGKIDDTMNRCHGRRKTFFQGHLIAPL